MCLFLIVQDQKHFYSLIHTKRGEKTPGPTGKGPSRVDKYVKNTFDEGQTSTIRCQVKLE